MSINVVLIIVGAVLLLVGLAKSGQRGGLSLRNLGINFGSTSTQTIKTGNLTPEPSKGGKSDWVGLAIAAIGLVTAMVGLFKG